LGKVKTSVTLEAEIWKRFQIAAIKAYGTKRGAISQALEEAMEDWIKKA
jgi:hypothetical protein